MSTHSLHWNKVIYFHPGIEVSGKVLTTNFEVPSSFVQTSSVLLLEEPILFPAFGLHCLHCLHLSAGFVLLPLSQCLQENTFFAKTFICFCLFVCFYFLTLQLNYVLSPFKVRPLVCEYLSCNVLIWEAVFSDTYQYCARGREWESGRGGEGWSVCHYWLFIHLLWRLCRCLLPAMSKARHTTTRMTIISIVSRTIPTDRAATPAGANPPPSGGATVGGDSEVCTGSWVEDVGGGIISVVSAVSTAALEVLCTIGISEGMGVVSTRSLVLSATLVEATLVEATLVGATIVGATLVEASRLLTVVVTVQEYSVQKNIK